MCEMPTVYDQATPTARKAHQCCECLGTIYPGEKYHRLQGLWDGSWQTYKMCLDCDELRGKVEAHLSPYEEHTPLGELYAGIFEAPCNAENILTFLAIQTYRGANIPDWMFEDLDAALMAQTPF